MGFFKSVKDLFKKFFSSSTETKQEVIDRVRREGHEDVARELERFRKMERETQRDLDRLAQIGREE